MATIKRGYGTDEDGNLMSTQVAVVRNYCIKTGKRVSQKMATAKWGFTRLSAIIYNLKDRLEREGGKWAVRDELVKSVNRYGDTCRFKEYWLEATGK